MKLSEQNQNQQQKSTSENQGERIITWEEYSNHITGQDCWVLINEFLYDVSDYLVQHPGGDDILLKYSGLDASKPFNDQQHSAYAISLRNARKVGKIETPEPTESYRKMLQQKKNKLRESKKSIFKKPVGSLNLTIEQVAQHNSEKSCWIILQNKVYDVTNYMSTHPGGEGLILDKAGKDATIAFRQAKHSEDALQKRNELLIGSLTKQESKTSNLVVIVFALIVIALIGFFAFKMF